jgi:hypothetical protein
MARRRRIDEARYPGNSGGWVVRTEIVLDKWKDLLID